MYVQYVWGYFPCGYIRSFLLYFSQYNNRTLFECGGTVLYRNLKY